MRKPIKFETFDVSGTTGPKFSLYANEGEIEAYVPSEFFSTPDADQWDRVADAIKRAAQALRESQRLTFGDLKPGEWFRWADGGTDAYTDGCGGYWYESSKGRFEHCAAYNKSAPVTRLRATFTEEPGNNG